MSGRKRVQRLVFGHEGHFSRVVVEAFLESLRFQRTRTDMVGVCKFQLVRPDTGPLHVGQDRFLLSATRMGLVSARQVDLNLFGRFGKDRVIIPDDWEEQWQRALQVESELGATPDADEVREDCTRPAMEFVGIPGYEN